MYYSIDDDTYWYEIHGEGIPVVMLHGFTGSTSTWQNFISDWQKDLQIITIDLPGHGKTRTNSPKTMEECCQDLKRLFQYLKLDNFHLLGYSMGGRTALSFAMFYPEMILSLILESASPGLATQDERIQRIEKDEALAKKIENEGIQVFVNFWEIIPLFRSQKSLAKDVQQTIRSERLSQSARGLTQSLRYMGTGIQPSWWNQLDQFYKPVLLLAGEYDEKFVSINKWMENSFPECNFDICKNAGHAIHVEQPEIFGKLVSEFILNS